MSKNKELVIRIKPTKKQAVCWDFLKDNIHKFVFFGGGAGGGKSWLGCEWALTHCIMYPGIKLFIGREELTRLKKSTYVTWLKVCKYHNIPKELWKLTGENIIEFIDFKSKTFNGNGSKIDLLNVEYQPRDPLYERFGSLEYTSGFLEEVGEIKEKAFDVLKSRIGRHQPDDHYVPPKIYLTGNPKKNWSYYMFYKQWKEGKKENGYSFDMVIDVEKPNFTIPCVFIQSLYKDNPHTISEYEENLKSIKDKVLRERLMNGNWEYEDEAGSLMDYENILAIFTRQFSEELNGDMYISVDVARSGNDKAVIMLWQGYFIKKVWYEDKTNTRWFADKIKSKAEQHYIPHDHIIIDEDGVGGGVVDNIEGSIGFVNGSRAVEEIDEDLQDTDRYSYVNLRSQCYYKLSEFVNAGKIGCSSSISGDIMTHMIEELEVVKRKDYDKNEKKLQVVPKDMMKDSLGRSPDYADTMMMRMYFELGLQANQDISVVW